MLIFNQYLLNNNYINEEEYYKMTEKIHEKYKIKH